MSAKSDSKSDVVVKLPIGSLRDFSGHPYKVRDDESMRETAESVKTFGVLVPIIVRPCDGGGYEIISGHRRKRACELAGIDAMPAIVRDLDDDAATIVMVDSNLQRENVLPSERAQAYKMKLEALRRQAGRKAKVYGMPYNRAVRDEAGKVQDIIAGPFFVCGLGEDDFCSLPKELQTKYLDMFKYPEKFTAIGGKLVITQDKPRAAAARQEAER